jgi:phosphate transport system permease protein
MTVQVQEPVDRPFDLTSSERHPGRFADRVFPTVTRLCVAAGIVVLGVLIFQIVHQGWGRISLDMITKFPSRRAETSGAKSAFYGTLWVIGFTALFCIPIGVGAAIYLEELADNNRWWNRLIEVNVQNLAAVPSIVYGILGLAVLVRALGFGQTVIAGSLTLTLMVLPTVIISSREAIRAVPGSLRQASMGLGATQLQTIGKIVLPASIPGIATGVILALSRAIGEAAPLILIGGLSFIKFNPTGPGSAFTVLPIQIYNWIQRPQDEYKPLAAAAIVVLLLVLLTMNSVAIGIRTHARRNS